MKEPQDQRQTGRTTMQMKDAPQGSVFVVTPGADHYTKRLAEHINRTDLRIVTLGWLSERNIFSCGGEITLDHFAIDEIDASRRYLVEAVHYHNERARL